MGTMLLAGAPARAADGLEATITDTFKFAVRVTALELKVKAKPGTGLPAATLDHLPLTSGSERVHVWLAQIDTATFTPKPEGRVAVQAVLQGEGETVEGVLASSRGRFFQGTVAEGDRKGRAVRVPLAEVASLEVHTKYEGAVKVAKAGEILPMPNANQDVLWVSSVPLGAEVYAKPFDCAAAKLWQTYMRIGKTPMMRELGPGKYAVKVMVPAKLAATLRPSTKLGEGSNPFEHDGWGEVHFKPNENVIASVVYTVMKREGRAATLISLFQKKGATLDEVLETFPEGHNFQFNEKKVEGALLYQQVPKADIARILEGLRRGGKIIWHGKTKSLMIDLTPGPRGFRIGGAQRPKGK
jgi:hypothetical protein